MTDARGRPRRRRWPRRAPRCAGALDRDWDVPAPGLDVDCCGDGRARRRRPVRLRRPDRAATPETGDLRAVHLLTPTGRATRRPGPRRAPGGRQRRRRAGARRLRRDARRRWPGPARPTSAAGTRTASPTRDGFAAMGTVEMLLHLHDVAGPLGLAWDPDPDVVRRVLDRLFPDAPADGDPWPTLLRRHRPRPGRAAGRQWQVGRHGPRAADRGSGQRSSSARELGLELAEAAPLVGAVLVGRENRTACSAISPRCHSRANSSRVSGRERLGAAAGLDVGEPRLVALGLAERLAQVALAGRQADGSPSPPGAARRGCAIRLPVCGSPCVTTQRSTLPATAAPSSANRRSAGSTTGRAVARAAARPAPTRGRRSTPSSRRQRSSSSRPACRAGRSGPPDRQVPRAGLAVQVAEQAGHVGRGRCRRRAGPAPAAPSRYGVRLSSSPGATSTATGASRVRTGGTTNGSAPASVGGGLVRREQGCALLVGGADRLDGREPVRPARRRRPASARRPRRPRGARRPGDVHAPLGAHGGPDPVGREAGGLDDHLSTLGSVSSRASIGPAVRSGEVGTLGRGCA